MTNTMVFGGGERRADAPGTCVVRVNGQALYFKACGSCGTDGWYNLGNFRMNGHIAEVSNVTCGKCSVPLEPIPDKAMG
jgi:hypothetical protein